MNRTRKEAPYFFTEVVMGLWYIRMRHHVAGSLCYGCYGSHHFYGSYDTDGKEAPPFLRTL